MNANQNLRPLIDKLWKLVVNAAEAMKREDSNIILDFQKGKFNDTFSELYESISNGYMKHPDIPLDRHKIAAILIISVIKANLLKVKNEVPVFLGNYVLATDCALSYMLSEMNMHLASKGKPIMEHYVFPDAMACETHYYKIFYRNLYFSEINTSWNLNPLDIAERLFLIEYITLRENDVDISILKEY